MSAREAADAVARAGDIERAELILELGIVCPCGIDLTRNGCYRCLVARGARYFYDPAATCPACGSAIPMEGHTCAGLGLEPN